jgi:predicted amidohydrolase
VSSDIRANAKYILRQTRKAKHSGAHVARFCEGALSGYAGSDFDSFEGFDWTALKDCSQQILERAGELEIWVLLGSAHRLSGRRKPHNCVYVIDPRRTYRASNSKRCRR